MADMADMAEIETPEPTGGSGTGPTTPAPAPTGVVEQEILRLYRLYLKRDPTAQEMALHKAQATSIGLSYLTTLDADLRTQAGTTTPTTPPNTPPPATTTAYSDAAFQAILAKYPMSNEGIKKAVEEANRTFGTTISVLDHPTRLDKVRLPDGRIIDVGIGATGTSGQWGWIDVTNGERGAGGGVDINANSIDPSYLAPFNEKPPGPGNVPTFQSPGDFVAPTADSILADPSYKFRLDQGRGVLENSAAARGTLNSGGTLIDVLNYGQKAASQEYGSIWDRSFGKWNADWTNALGKFGADSQSSDSQYNRLWKAYVERKDTYYRNQNEPWRKLYDAASLGAGAAR